MRLFIAFCFLLGIDHWSCSSRVTGPQDQVGLSLEIHFSDATGLPGQPVTAVAVVTNQRPSSVYHVVPCVGTAIGVEVLGPTGRAVYLSDPRFLPACPDDCCAPLAPREKIESPLYFDGTLYTAAGEHYAAPPGEYTLVARFEATTAPRGGRSVSVTRRVSFRWAEP